MNYYSLISSMSKGSGFDPDAFNYINAVPITNIAQKDAVNTLVLNLKSYGLWSKIKAFYPAFLTTAAENKWNLKDPRNLDAAYRLTFFGGITHSLNGMLGDGTSGYAYTNIPENTFGLNNMSVGWYNMNNLANSVVHRYALGMSFSEMEFRYFDGFSGAIQRLSGTLNFFTNSATQKGMYVMSRQNSTQALAYKNGTLQHTATQAGINSLNTRIGVLFAKDAGGGTPSAPTVSFYGAWHGNCIFFADGMNGTEVSNMTTAINTFNTALGRGIDTDALAFITNANITDNTQQNAINTLVIALKSANIWTKIIAFYPFVGGNATAHSYNLINTSNYRLTFMGGGTHSSLGYIGNGTTGYAKTGIIPNSVFTQNNIHVSYYSQTDAARSANDLGVYQGSKAPIEIYMRYNTTSSFIYVNSSTGSLTISGGRRYLVASRQSSSTVSATNNGITSSISSNSAAALATIEIYIHSSNFNGTPNSYSNRTSSTITFGQTLTDAEAQTLSTIVNTFNTTLGRNVY